MAVYEGTGEVSVTSGAQLARCGQGSLAFKTFTTLRGLTLIDNHLFLSMMAPSSKYSSAFASPDLALSCRFLAVFSRSRRISSCERICQLRPGYLK